MNQELFSPKDSILFVGEGNFSFVLSFIKNQGCNVKHVAATCFEGNKHSEVTLNNIKELQHAGVKVHVGIDATKLTSHPEIVKQQFTCVIFNFPHVGGKMKIHKNRKLLKDFFASSVSLLLLNTNEKEVSRKIIVSLCKGQGGTPADGESLRIWGNSWQVVEMAALSGLILTQIEPFCHALCPGYASVGYRSRENWFHTENALVHVFKLSSPILVFSPTDDKEYPVCLETSKGNIICGRIYLEYAGFTETQSGCFKQIPTENSLEISLFHRLYSFLLKDFDNLQFIQPTKLPLYCDYNDSQIPCVLDYGVTSWLRSSFFDVIKCYVGNLQNVNLISHGPVFQMIGKNFSTAPARQQAVIHSYEVDKFVDAVLQWISKELDINKEDLNIKHEEQWTLHFRDKIVAEKRECGFVIELSTLAMIKYKITGFRDLLEARIMANNDQCILASVFPSTHVLDICFLEGLHFSEDKLWSILWHTLGHWVVDIKLLDIYVPKNENWVSRCYRISYRSSKEALSRVAAVNLHQCVLPQILIDAELALKVL